MVQYLVFGRDVPENEAVLDQDVQEEDQVREEVPGLALEVPDLLSCP